MTDTTKPAKRDRAEEYLEELTIKCYTIFKGMGGDHLLQKDAIRKALQAYGAEVRAQDVEALNNPNWELILELCGDPLILAASDEKAAVDALKIVAAYLERTQMP